MGRPIIANKKKSLSVSINVELNEILNKICEDKNINKSKYIEHLIKNEINNLKNGSNKNY